MESADLYYDSHYGLIICFRHETGLIPTGIKLHLQRQHRLKGAALHAVLTDIESHTFILHHPVAVHPSPPPTPAVRGLAVEQGFQCQLPNCNDEKEALSRHKRTVEKHQARIHKVPNQRQRKGQRTWQSLQQSISSPVIKSVIIQSFFPQPFYRPFVVVPASSPPSGPPSGPPPRSPPSSLSRSPLSRPSRSLIQQKLRQDHSASQQAAQAALQSIPTDQYKSQVPPWLVQTGVGRYLAGLDKDLIYRLIAPAGSGRSLQDCMRSPSNSSR
jgi:hypothetical protein